MNQKLVQIGISCVDCGNRAPAQLAAAEQIVTVTDGYRRPPGF